MAKESVEQILEEEYRRLTRGVDGSKASGLLDIVGPLGGTPTVEGGMGIRPANRETLLAGVQALPAAQAINKGYTLPAPPTPESETTKESSVAGEIGKTALKFFTSGLGVMPLISGLAGLFGGGESPAPLVKYAMPRAIQIAAANSRGGSAVSQADYNQDGTARSFGASSGGAAAVTPTSQIVVNVQAMDSRSFLDHSQEIAQAVRDAMLNMHALNDVVSEL